MLLPDAISVTMMTSSSKFKQYFEGANLNPGYAPKWGQPRHEKSKNKMNY